MNFWEAVRAASREIGGRRTRSWAWAAAGFEQGLAHLQSSPETWRQGECIWLSGRNDVFRLILPPECGDFEIIYKYTRGSRRPRFWHAARISYSTREAVNLLAMARLGFPMAEVLAVGETRTPRGCKESFLVTRFAAGYRDGRHILPEYEKGDRPDLRDAFIRVCLTHLAGMHAMRIYHKAFKLYNIMWREVQDGVEPLFIDVSSCRGIRFKSFLPYAVHDLADFLSPLGLDDAELVRWLGHYAAARPDRPGEADITPAMIRAGMEKVFFNWDEVAREKPDARDGDPVPSEGGG